MSKKVDVTILNKTPFGILVWYMQEGKKEQARVYRALATWNPNSKSVDLFEENTNNLLITLREDMLGNIRVVTPELKETFLGAEYGLPLTMEDLPDTFTADDAVVTGLKWKS